MKNKCLFQEEIDDLKQAFDLFINEETEKISPNEIFEAMKTLGLESKNPIIYEFIIMKILDYSLISFYFFVKNS